MDQLKNKLEKTKFACEEELRDIFTDFYIYNVFLLKCMLDLNKSVRFVTSKTYHSGI